MAEKQETQSTSGTLTQNQKKTTTTKSVRNRSGHRVELVINGKVVVFQPGKITNVPIEFEVPKGLGLYVR